MPTRPDFSAGILGLNLGHDRKRKLGHPSAFVDTRSPFGALRHPTLCQEILGRKFRPEILAHPRNLAPPTTPATFSSF